MDAVEISHSLVIAMLSVAGAGMFRLCRKGEISRALLYVAMSAIATWWLFSAVVLFRHIFLTVHEPTVTMTALSAILRVYGVAVFTGFVWGIWRPARGEQWTTRR